VFSANHVHEHSIGAIKRHSLDHPFGVDGNQDELAVPVPKFHGARRPIEGSQKGE
jgi:hypothetical protein